MSQNKSLTVEQVAKELCVCRASVWNFIKLGKIASFKFGNRRRIRECDLSAYIERNMQEVKSKDNTT